MLAEKARIAAEAELSGSIVEAVKQINEIEGMRQSIAATEADLYADALEMDAIQATLEEEASPIDLDSLYALEARKARCKGTCDTYANRVADLTLELSRNNEIIDAMAESLAQFDPNTDNKDEGVAFIRKMYKVRGMTTEDTTVIMPETPEECVDLVAGKVIQIEDLQDDIDETEALETFFAEVYCSAFVNSLITMKDGLSQIFPGGLDFAVEDELMRVYGPFDIDNVEIMDQVEIEAVMSYMAAIEGGEFERDESILINRVEPLAEAIALCTGPITEEMEGAI